MTAEPEGSTPLKPSPIGHNIDVTPFTFYP
jgi:hypothetical protein